MNGDYTVGSDFSDPVKKEITFNFCKLIQGCGSANTFASMEENGQCVELTDGNVHATLNDSVTAESGADGIRIARESPTLCPSDDSRNIGFVVDVFCNEQITGAAPPPMKMIMTGSNEDDIGDECIYHVQLAHEAGCATFAFTNIRRLFGALMIFVGVVLTYLRQKS